MCKQGRSSAMAGDEVWEAGSASSGSDSECESEVGTPGNTPRRPQGGAPASRPPTVALQTPPKLAGSLAAARPPLPALPQRLPLPSKPAPAAAPEPASMMTLVTHLRRDNARLREALVQAQRDAEEAMLQGEEGKGSGVDFAHLLSLVRDFGEDLGALGAEEPARAGRSAAWSAEGEVEAFAIHSPREGQPPRAPRKAPPLPALGASTALPAGVEAFSMCSARGDAPADAAASSLEERLQASLDDAARLRLELARKDAELAALREREAQRLEVAAH